MLSNAQSLDLTFAALANAKRRAILTTLSFRPATVGQLASEHTLSLPSIHRHIRTLEQARLIERRKVGRVNFVALNKQALATAQTWIMQYRTEWGNSKETLENYIEQLKK